MPQVLQNFDKCCVHSITLKRWSIEEQIDRLVEVGVKGITLWRQSVEGKNYSEIQNRIRQAGLTTVSYCRGGFFPGITSSDRAKSIDENMKTIDEAAALGAPMVVLVCGSLPNQNLIESRKQIIEGIEHLLPYAEKCGVKLAIEPLHPMYAGDRSAINTLAQSNEICAQLQHPFLGVALDVFHVWWEPNLEAHIQECARLKALFAFHVCDWKINMADMLNDRGLMGEGCIPIRQIRGWVEDAGFQGFNEVEIFSNRYWAEEPEKFLELILKSYQQNT
ncbi:MAG: sugar phosphate isomerase/epimerase family protein [Verrucomicrobiota bacterium]